MGFIHETNSEILSVEARSESLILGDTDKNDKHLYFFCEERKSQTREEIAQEIMTEAGRFYAQGKSDEAEKYKQAAEIVRKVSLSPDRQANAFEVSKEWVKELVRFTTEEDVLSK